MPTKTTKSETSDSAKTLTALLEAGAHFGHQTRRWNPKMGKYIFGAKNNIHIIDLVQTETMLGEAQKFLSSVVAGGGTVLFVGTKRQARPIITEVATKTGMPYVTERWLGGMLTNFATISDRVKYLKKLESQKESGELATRTKKENLLIDDEIAHLNHVLGGIREMRRLPEALFVVDVPREGIAIAEARKLNIPVVAIVDSNADPDLVDYIIPANDDAIRSIKFIVGSIGDAVASARADYLAKVSSEQNATEDEANAN